LAKSADQEEIFLASLRAADTGLARLPEDRGFTQTLSTAFEFLDALQSQEIMSALKLRGFVVPESPNLFDYIGAFKNKADSELVNIRGRSDTSEIAQNSFTETLVKEIGPSIPSLFETTPEDTQKAIRDGLRGKALETIMHRFFTGFTHRYLDYYLSRELPNHVGTTVILPSIDSHNQFSEDFETYIRQTVRITKEFVPGWYGKARYEKRLNPAEVKKFVHVAIKKIREEFKRGARTNG
jgi:hypothetical protein